MKQSTSTCMPIRVGLVRAGIFGVAATALLLAACGDSGTTENITQITQNAIDVVADVSDLPKCTKSNDGEMMWVKNETTPRMCSEGKWYAVAEGSVAMTCTTEPLPDESGVKILCGGDSIGVVYNGRDGKDMGEGIPGEAGQNGKDGEDGAPGKNGKDGDKGKDGASCSMEKISDLFVRVICGTDSTVLYAGNAPDTTTQGEVVLDSEKIAISLDEVSGVSQKGPFLNGSKVLVHEIADGRSLKLTGNAFNGKIANDKGEFRINARMLVSQYVSLEATGYYRNEVTGANSNSELTLFAISDVSDRNVVNVNLLTHLEYERVKYLVTQKKQKVKNAKKQAQREIFAILSIDAKNFSNSEDLNLTGSSDEDAALLAFSAVLQGDRSVADLSELLTKIATDLGEDGTWDDSVARMGIADWAATADSAGRLDSIRSHVTGWGLSSMVPNFEKYVRYFWTKEFALDSCKEGRVGNVVSASKGPRKDRETRFICKEGSDGYRWYFANDFEKDTYGWNDTTDGAIKRGNIGSTIYVFDSTGSNGNKGWRVADHTEQQHGGCRSSMYGEIVDDLWYGGYFLCQETSHRWVAIGHESHLVIDTRLWTETDDGFSRRSESSDAFGNTWSYCYVHDTSSAYRGWREGNDLDCDLGILGCTKGRLGQVQRTTEGNYYVCVNDTYYGSTEDNYTWQRMNDNVVINTNGWACLDSNEGEVRKGQLEQAYFVCEDNHWRDALPAEERDCVLEEKCLVHKCSAKKRGKFAEIDGERFICDKGVWEYDYYFDYRWRKPNCAEIKTGSQCMANDSAVVWNCEDLGNFKVDYICVLVEESNDEEPNIYRWVPVKNSYDYTLTDWNTKKGEYYTADVNPDAEYGSDLVDSRDGKVYKTVYIGGKRWMAENLRYSDSIASVNLKMHCVGDYIRDRQINCPNEDYSGLTCNVGGVLYSWSAAMDLDPKWNGDIVGSMIEWPRRGVCPAGWHIPDTTEWKNLLQNANYASLQMKGFPAWSSATDASGFSVMIYDLDYASFWSSTEVSAEVNNAYIFAVGQDYADFVNYEVKGSLRNVRCVEDDGVGL